MKVTECVTYFFFCKKCGHTATKTFAIKWFAKYSAKCGRCGASMRKGAKARSCTVTP